MFGTRGAGHLAILFFLAVLAGCGGGNDNRGGKGGGGGEEPLACQAEADCPSEQPFCQAGLCVACLEDTHCEGDRPICREGACSPCVANDDCSDADAPRCDVGSGRCVGCEEDQDCPGGRCGEAGLCVACLVNEDCPDGRACTSDNVCAPAGVCEIHTDCGTNELCVFADQSSPLGRCGGICDPQLREAACEEGKRCQFAIFDDNNKPLGACVVPTGGAAEQESCLNATCDTGLLCVGYNEEGSDKRCTSACDPVDPESCGRGYSCTSIDFTSPVGASIGLCIPTNVYCETSNDCNSDEVCNIALAEEGGVVRICGKKAGTKPGGAACTAHPECESDFCLTDQGVCFGFCDRPADCSDGSTCVDVTFGISETDSENLPACFPSCTSDNSCGDTQACVYVHSYRNDELVNICTARRGASQPGEPCEWGADCTTGSCNYEWGICEGLCESDLDCLGNTQCTPSARRVDSGPDGLSSTSDDSWQMVPLCRGMECTKDSDCGDWLCVPEVDHRDRSRDSVGMRCTPPLGAFAATAPCTANSQCSTNLCFDPRVGREDCYDGIDNDGDGLVDCEDPLCYTACFTEVECGDGNDDDGDGAVDCADGDCYWECYWGEGNCHDGLDNDGNGLIDCDDPECKYACGLYERHCDNGRDDDGDGLVDCDDPDCRWDLVCQGVPVEGRDISAECSDGIDNDGDGLIDCEDPHCADHSSCRENVCATGNCCADGLDNDGDGLVDCFDRDCSNDSACYEANCTTGDCCTDGIDNDGNGAVDCADYTCAGHPACNEAGCTTGNCCGDGLDNDGDGLFDCADPDCFGAAACMEINCSDGADNDGDGLTDCDDPDCWERSHCAEKICFGACVTDADCGTGFVCVDGLHPVRMVREGRWEYVPACAPALSLQSAQATP